MTWQFEFEETLGARRYRVLQGDRPATVECILDGWESDDSFRSRFTSELAALPYSAFRWETPAVTDSTLQSDWEFVVLESPALARARPDPVLFKDHFRLEKSVVTFANLGGDATLVVPCPRGSESAYGHIAAFVRYAASDQQHTLWQVAASAMRERIGKKPVWLSTAGSGVPWLHVRLDDRPKYYGWSGYRT